MPLQKILFKPGVNRENTRYTTEGGWYEADKVRFRQGTPEKIGGWVQFSAFTFLGVCRSLWNWVTLGGQNLIGVGTSLKFYINQGGQYYDITPVRKIVNPMLGLSGTGNPFTAVNGSYIITVYDANHGCNTDDFVIFSGATGLGTSITAAVLNNVLGYRVTKIDANTYTITSAVIANATDAAASPGGGAVAVATYLLNVGTEVQTPFTGWGGGGWGLGGWGTNKVIGTPLQLWTQSNFGEDLIFGPSGGAIYYWDANVQLPGQEFTVSIASPAVLTFAEEHGLFVSDAIQLNTTGALPTGLSPNITYYVNTVPTTTTLTLRTSATASSATTVLSGVSITGIAGQFACTAMSPALAVGQSITISGTLGGTGTITGYVNPTTYFIIATNGSTTFTLSTTAGGSGVVTTAGTPTGLTYTLSTAINTSGTQSGVQSLSVRGIPLASLSGASDVPTVQNLLFVSDASRFVFAFGCNDIGDTIQDPMLIRWSDQEDPAMWAPATTNQAGSIRLSHGSKIVSAIQTRQEIVVFTDASVYSLQYLGAPYVWGSQLLGDNISIMGPNSVALASGIVYWMGVDKFYSYDGRVDTLSCNLRKYIFQDINLSQNYQIFGSTNEGFNEVWWFYCSAGSTVIDKYVVYNYLEKIWYYGTMARTAWLDSGLQDTPIATTYGTNGEGKIVNHEQGVDDAENTVVLPIEAYISSSEFDIGDGHNFGFVWRMLPDLSFTGSDPATTPQLTLTVYPMQNSGSGTGTAVTADVDQLTGVEYLITEGFTGQVNTRLRGRQLIIKASSDTLGTAWQLGATRIDIRPDGRR
jgi:hypothetical protein